MMYLHYCKNCDRIHILNGHKSACPGCDRPLAELSVSFVEYANMNAAQRDAYRKRCGEEP